MSDYHPNLDGPAEPVGLAMKQSDFPTKSLFAAPADSVRLFNDWWCGKGKRAVIEATPCMQHADRNEWGIAEVGARVAWDFLHNEKALKTNKPLTAFQKRLHAALTEHKKNGIGAGHLSERFWPHGSLDKRRGAWQKMGACLNRLKAAGSAYEHHGRWFPL